MMKTISVFCGANAGNKSIYQEKALEFTEGLVKEGFTLAYGGGNIGLMGAIANHALELGGHVIGVIPEILAEKELAHNGLSEMHLVKDMLERKKYLIEISDAFVALPGGLGTMDEFFEVLVLNQIGYHRKPVALLNTDGYYDHLQAFINQGLTEGFVLPESTERLIVENTPDKLLEQLKAS